jgi:hypothetical protein
MTFQTHPAERRDDSGNIIPMDHRYLHLAEARGKAHRLSPEQLAVELDTMGDAIEANIILTRKWHQALVEEAAQRLRGVDGSLRGQA